MKYVSQLLLSCILLLAPACCTRVGCEKPCAPSCGPVCSDCTTDCPVAPAPEPALTDRTEPVAEEPASAQAEQPVSPEQVNLPAEDQALASEGDYEMSYDEDTATTPAPVTSAPVSEVKTIKEPTKQVKKDDLSK